ncbi:MAG: polysaccharide deacetylase family protein [Solirubrobacterales bacterium]
MAGGDLIVLCYHAVSEDWPAALSVTPQSFEFQIDLLASRGYRGTTFTRAALGDVDGKTIAVTFDDGYRSINERARPILESYGFPATVFVPASVIESKSPLAWPGTDRWLDGPHELELEPMSIQELRELSELGWEIGSHTLTHPKLPLLDDDELRDELVGSRRACGKMIDAECTSIAFPYGATDARVLRASEEAGYSAAALLGIPRGKASGIACPRIGVYHADGSVLFRIKLSPTVRRLRRSRAWVVVEKLRALIRRG